MTRLLLLLSACAPAAAEGPTNPHGKPDGCLSCHQEGAEAGPVGAPLPIVATCRSCHPTADMHPVGMAPVHVAVAAGWPLEDGLVTCATCHAEPAHGPQYAALPEPWHRGGPYARITGLCYSCHEAAEYTRSNPHQVGAPRDTGDGSCAACHTAIPREGAAAEEARLRFATAEACATCHQGPVHSGVDEHLGKRVDPAPAGLTLDREGRITCWTCHEVHEPAADPGHRAKYNFRGHFLDRDWSALSGAAVSWPGSGDEAHPALLALPASDGSLCRACHQEVP